MRCPFGRPRYASSSTSPPERRWTAAVSAHRGGLVRVGRRGQQLHVPRRVRDVGERREMKGVADVPIAPARNGRVCPRQVRNPSGPAARSWKDVSATPAPRCVGAHQCVRPLQPKHDAARVVHSLVCVKRAEGPAHRRRPLGRRSPGTRCPGLTPGICSQATAGCAPLLGALAIAPPSKGPAVDPGVNYLPAGADSKLSE